MRNFIYSLFGLAVLAAAAVSSCGRAANVTTPTTADYDLRGGIVKNLDNDSTQAVFVVTKNNALYDAATLIIYGDTIPYDTTISLYNKIYSGLSMPSSGLDTLQIVDSTNLNEKFAFTLPDSFYLTSISLPDNRINAGGADVQIQWAASLQNSGYIFAVVLKDSTYIDDGYAEFVDAGVTYATIPPDAFRIYGDSLTIGWYYVYVYSYNGNPASTYNLPTYIPAGLTDNISKEKITGRYGTIVVSPRDSIYVDVSS